MPRPQRYRRVCHEPEYTEFKPEGRTEGESIILTIDEYEVIRIVDLEGHTHEECAESMDISRTTVTEIYASARKKIADAIVNGRQLVITGGRYRLCEGEIVDCKTGVCSVIKEIEGLDLGSI